MRLPEALVPLLESAQRAGATALHLVPDAPPRIRLGGEIRPLESPPDSDGCREPLSATEMEEIVNRLVPKDDRTWIQNQGHGELPIELPSGHPATVSLFRAQGRWRVVILLVDSGADPVSL